MKSIAIMQPYFFPYIGYWQLINSVDRFIIYDDVNYIKGGWINRNRILINTRPTYITAPLYHASPFKKICDTTLHPSAPWRDKLVRAIEVTYRKSVFFHEIFPVIERLIGLQSENLSAYLVQQLQTLAACMNIKTEFVTSSRCYQNDHLSGQDRVIDICKEENADIYINAKGGATLYAAEVFNAHGIALKFIIMRALPYQQKGVEFIPYLSIIDALMAVGFAGIMQHLNAFDLETAQNVIGYSTARLI